MKFCKLFLSLLIFLHARTTNTTDLIKSEPSESPPKIKIISDIKELHCKHDIKKSFTNIRFRFLSEIAVKADAETKRLCPAMRLTCCHPIEIKQIYRSLITNLSIISDYFKDIKELYISMINFNTTQMLQDLRVIRSNNLGKCITKNHIPDLELAMLNLQFDSRKILRDYDNQYRAIVKFQTGIICGIFCNALSHERFSFGPDGKLQLILQNGICGKLFEMEQAHLDLSKRMLTLYKLAFTFSCLYTDKRIDQKIIDDLELRLKNEMRIINRCFDPQHTKLNMQIDPICIRLCQKLFVFNKYVNTFNFLSVSAIINKIFNLFSQRQFKISESESSVLAADIDNSNSANFFRRVFDIWPPIMHSVYTNENYERKIDYDGISIYTTHFNLRTNNIGFEMHPMQNPHYESSSLRMMILSVMIVFGFVNLS